MLLRNPIFQGYVTEHSCLQLLIVSAHSLLLTSCRGVFQQVPKVYQAVIDHRSSSLLANLAGCGAAQRSGNSWALAGFFCKKERRQQHLLMPFFITSVLSSLG